MKGERKGDEAAGMSGAGNAGGSRDVGMRGGRLSLLRVAHWTMFLVGVALIVRFDVRHRQESVRREPTAEELASVLGGAGAGPRRQDPLPHYPGVISDGRIHRRAAVVSTTDLPPVVKGYVDEINALVVVDETGTIRAIKILQQRETPAYMRKIMEAGFLERLINQKIGAGLEQIDGVTGASITAEALRRDIEAAAALAAQKLFQLPAETPEIPSWRKAWREPHFIAGAVVLVAALFARFSPRPVRRRREASWLLSLVLLGIYAQTPYTLVHTFQLLRLDLPGPANPLLALLALFILITTLLFGPLWCGQACPFGALQEFLRRLPLRRWTLSPRLLHAARELRFLVLFTAVLGAFGLRMNAFAEVEPFGHLFSRSREPIAWAFIITVLLAAMFVPRFWCRFFCPTGACLAILSSHQRWFRTVQRGVEELGLEESAGESNGSQALGGRCFVPPEERQEGGELSPKK